MIAGKPGILDEEVNIVSATKSGRSGKKDITAKQDFSLGGTNSVRGWDLDSRRGKNQFINTAEYRVTVVRPKALTIPFGLSLDVGATQAEILPGRDILANRS